MGSAAREDLPVSFGATRTAENAAGPAHLPAEAPVPSPETTLEARGGGDLAPTAAVKRGGWPIISALQGAVTALLPDDPPRDGDFVPDPEGHDAPEANGHVVPDAPAPSANGNDELSPLAAPSLEARRPRKAARPVRRPQAERDKRAADPAAGAAVPPREGAQGGAEASQGPSVSGVSGGAQVLVTREYEVIDMVVTEVVVPPANGAAAKAVAAGSGRRRSFTGEQACAVAGQVRMC